MNATPKQVAFLRRLLLSSAIPPHDADRTQRWLESGPTSADRVSQGIDWAKGLIDTRDQARAASSERKAQWQANQPQPHNRRFEAPTKVVWSTEEGK